MGLFKKKYPVDKEFANFSGQYIGTGQVGAYIIWLYKNKGMSHLGYRYRKEGGELRFIIYGLPDDKWAESYFRDRCPGMIEFEIDVVYNSGFRPDFHFKTWSNGLEEVCEGGMLIGPS